MDTIVVCERAACVLVSIQVETLLWVVVGSELVPALESEARSLQVVAEVISTNFDPGVCWTLVRCGTRSALFAHKPTIGGGGSGHF